jgi:hypothetical protein
MELTKVWTENKKAIITTAVCVIVGLLVIKFFDLIFWGSVLVALAVGAVLGWNHLSKKYGGVDGIRKALFNEVGIK